MIVYSKMSTKFVFIVSPLVEFLSQFSAAFEPKSVGTVPDTITDALFLL